MAFDDLARIFYWGCIFIPLIGIIGLFTCNGVRSRIRCTIVISLLTLVCTVVSACVTDNFFLPSLLNHDGITSFLRVIITTGATFVVLLMRFWKAGRGEKLKDNSCSIENMVIFQLIIALTLLLVVINNFFIVIILLFLLVVLFVIACLMNGGAERIRLGWDYFRYLLFFMLFLLIGVFLLNGNLVSENQLLIQLGSFIISLGIIMGAGIFPVCIPFIRMMVSLPVSLGAIGLFIVPISFFSLFLRLHQIPHYHEVNLLSMVLATGSLFFLILKEKRDSFLLLIAPIFISLLFLTGIFIPHFEALYSTFMVIISLVILAPLGYIFKKSQNAHVFQDWLLIVFAGFPPFNVFFIWSVFIPYLTMKLPFLGYGILILLAMQGCFLLYDRSLNLCSRELFCRNGYISMTIIILQTMIVPVLARQWIIPLTSQFIQ